MPKRSYSAAGSYRYGFNGKENDNDVKGLGNQQDYGMRIYDARVGRFLSVDPITDEYPELTPYQFASNRAIDGSDKDGLEWELGSESEKLKARGGTIMRRISEIEISPFAFYIHKEPEILKADIYGRGWIGPKSLVNANIKAVEQKYYFQIGENIRNGPMGAIGYLVGGDRGSYVGASVDGIMLSFGGLPGETSLSPRGSFSSARLSLKATTPNTTVESPPVDLVVAFKSTWNKSQINQAVEKVNFITNSPDTRTTTNPVQRMSNLRSNFKKAGGFVTDKQQVDHKRDLQLGGNNMFGNLWGLDASVNTSLGKQFQLQLGGLPNNTQVNKVGIRIGSFKSFGSFRLP